MSTRIFSALAGTFLAGSLTACTNAPAGYEGIFGASFERSSFQPCGSDQTWWLNAASNEVWLELIGQEEDTGGMVVPDRYVVVEGTISTDEEVRAARERLGNSSLGGFGHLGVFDREIMVTAVLETRPVKQEDLKRCLPAKDDNE